MARCDYCKRNMLTSNGCIKRPVEYPDGARYAQILCVEAAGDRCHDCGAKGGYPHHPSCDMERCGRCRSRGIPNAQLISCGCLDTEEDKREAEQMRLAVDAWEQRRGERGAI